MQASYARKDIFDESNLLPLFAPLEGDVVNDEAYLEAATEGIDAVPDLEHVSKPKPDGIAEIWLSKSRRYAADFPARIAQDVSAAAFAAQAAGDDDDAVLAAVDDAIEAKRANALQYAEPPWGAGNHAYGAALDASGVLMDWVCEPGACDVCSPMPEGNPYTLQALPMWPGDPHPFCRCHVTPDDTSWQQIFGEHAA